MAAGKISLTRLVDLPYVSNKRVSDRCVDFEFGGKIRSDFCNDVEVSGAGGRVRVVEGMDFDEGYGVPPQKRRRFSPINGDVEGKENCAMNELWPSPVEGCSTLMEEMEGDGREPGQLDEEDYARAPNISTSRWAIQDDLEELEGKGKGGVFVEGEDLKRSSSPESGVTEKDSSDGSGEGYLSRYYRGGACYGSDLEDYMELDGEDKRDVIVREIDLDFDDGLDAEAGMLGRRNMLQACRSVYDFERLCRISEGSYGVVHKARDKESGELVALKKLKMETGGREGFPVHFLREINTQMALNHPSIVNVREVVVDDSVKNGFENIYMVMDYVEHDVKALMKSRKQCFSQSEVKCLMLQLLEGVKYLHDNWVLHRDLKTSNLLLNNKGELKICDFGMARQYGSPLKPYTSLVVTLWYRAPELLLGAEKYSTAVDMWSVGCIMAELLTNESLFDGNAEPEQINKIFKILGTPNDKIWPGYSELPGSKCKYVNQPYNLLHKKLPRASFTGSPVLSDLGLDLLSRLLTYDPEKRITAEEALNHRWFQEVPFPKTKEFMPTFPAN